MNSCGISKTSSSYFTNEQSGSSEICLECSLCPVGQSFVHWPRTNCVLQTETSSDLGNARHLYIGQLSVALTTIHMRCFAGSEQVYFDSQFGELRSRLTALASDGGWQW